jgi:hypothetical protein
MTVLAAAVFSGLAVAGALTYQAMQARDQLIAARPVVERAQAYASEGDFAAAGVALAELQSRTRSARDATDGPLWKLGASLPAFGDDLLAARTVSVQLDILATDVLPPLLELAEGLAPETLRAPDGAIRLQPLVAAGPGLAEAHHRVTGVDTALGLVDRDGLVHPLHKALDDLDDAVDRLATLTSTASRTARLLPPLLGMNARQRYLVVIQNLAESRGTGGITGAYAVIEADAGRVRLSTMASNDDLDEAEVVADFGQDYLSLYGHPSTTFANTNLSPHFPYAAELMQTGAQDVLGVTIDGVIATDPVALGYLLDATGPVTVAKGEIVSAANAASFAMSTIYERFPSEGETPQRDAQLQRVGMAALQALLSGRGETWDLARALTRAVDERRVLVHVDDPDVQAQLLETPVAGVLPTTSGHFLGVSHVQMLPNKLDYYLERRVTYEVSSCHGGQPHSTATVQLTSTAPASGLPDYVDGPARSRSVSRLRLALHGTPGSSPRAIEVDGRPARATLVSELGRPVVAVVVDVPPGGTTVVTMTSLEPTRQGRPDVWVQPGVNPPTVETAVSGCPDALAVAWPGGAAHRAWTAS